MKLISAILKPIRCKGLLALFLLILFCFSAKAQYYTQYPSKEYLEAQKLADSMKVDGAILVRLKSKQKQIEQLAIYNSSKAEEVKSRQILENRKIVKAFREKFNFCPVYFFYSHHSLQVKNGELNNVFLNDSLTIDSNITIKENRVFIAEFGSLDSDRLGINALYLMDENFKYLQKPFPYYVRTFKTLFFLKKSKSEVVSELSMELSTFHSLK